LVHNPRPGAARRQCITKRMTTLRAFLPTRSSKDSIMVELHTNHGVIKLELDAEKAPKSVENFLNYVKAGHYDNTVFHRVIDGFMIQGGGFEPGMKQKPTAEPINNEANNGLKNVNGSVAMARTNDPHSATAQFFINVNDNDFLNHSSPTPQGWGYAVFGKVVEGMDIVEKIKKVKTGSKGFHQDVPADDVVIEKAVIVE
jgi:peptidyl-prolyl cis-trans isomerase B (cyclophilin B)